MAGRLYNLLVVAGVTVAGLLLLDLGGRLLLPSAEIEDTTQSRPDPRATLPAYRTADYDPAVYWREFHAAKQERYEPFVVWRQRAFDGELIDIDPAGNRATPASRSDPAALRVWIMGGSVAWGMGAPDHDTVANHLAARLQQAHPRGAIVRNLGEIGYVSSQELTQLLRELQRGRRPDIVVFLDGANDAPAAALWPEPAGTHMNFYEIRDRFEANQARPPPVWALLRNSGVYRIAQAIARRLMPSRAVPPPWDAPADPAETRRRGEQAAAIWLRNQELIRSLGRSFDFRPLFVLQPGLMVGAKPLHRSEEDILAAENRNDAKRLSMDVYRVMIDSVRAAQAKDPRTDLVDAVDAFADHPEPLYIDYVHLAGPGNRILAEGIFTGMVDAVCGQPTLPAGLATHCALLAAD